MGMPAPAVTHMDTLPTRPAGAADATPLACPVATAVTQSLVVVASRTDIIITTADLTATGALVGASGRCRTATAKDPEDHRACRLPLVVVTFKVPRVRVATATWTSTGGQEGGEATMSGMGIDARTKLPTTTATMLAENAIPGVPFIRPIPSSIT